MAKKKEAQAKEPTPPDEPDTFDELPEDRDLQPNYTAGLITEGDDDE